MIHLSTDFGAQHFDSSLQQQPLTTQAKQLKQHVSSPRGSQRVHCITFSVVLGAVRFPIEPCHWLGCYSAKLLPACNSARARSGPPVSVSAHHAPLELP